MQKLLCPRAFGAVIALGLVAFAQTASAASVSETVSSSLAGKNLTQVQKLLDQQPQNTDEIVRALLKKSQTTFSQDPAFAGKMMTMAGRYAPQVTPPAVPAICADLRRAIEAIPLDQVGTSAHDQAMKASEDFANAPVVVAQGRPNLCEDALLASAPAARGKTAIGATSAPGAGTATPLVVVDKSLTNTVSQALANKKLSEVRDLLGRNPQNTDEIIKAILKTTQNSIAQDPHFSGEMMSLAGEYAGQITPPAVPAICADLRRVVEAMPLEQIGTPVYDQVMDATQNFSSAPVVVAQGRPNMCEDALLAQTPNRRPPTVKVPNRPPFNQPPAVKPSAD